jgi:hypothetical protein
MKKQIIAMATSIILPLSSAWSASYKVNQGEVQFTAKGFLSNRAESEPA